MFKRLITGSIILFLCSTILLAQNVNIDLTLEQSMQLVHNENKSLKIASKETEWAKYEPKK